MIPDPDASVQNFREIMLAMHIACIVYVELTDSRNIFDMYVQCTYKHCFNAKMPIHLNSRSVSWNIN